MVKQNGLPPMQPGLQRKAHRLCMGKAEDLERKARSRRLRASGGRRPDFLAALYNAVNRVGQYFYAEEQSSYQAFLEMGRGQKAVIGRDKKTAPAGHE
ncbi:MAG: hypothetical protein LBT33_02715 [Spirochaetia bacterium]|nr:hypothetical protein [Spirochaetia bacterium]